MDIQKRDALLAKAGDLGDFNNPAVWVEIEDFFDGNDDLESIWCNLAEPPGEWTTHTSFLGRSETGQMFRMFAFALCNLMEVKTNGHLATRS